VEEIAKLFAQCKGDLNVTSGAAYIPDSRMRALARRRHDHQHSKMPPRIFPLGGRRGRRDDRPRRREASEIKAGQELAEKICSRCHVVSEKVGSPFPDIAKGDHTTPNALRDFLHTTHANVSHPGSMPNQELTEQQIDELATYIASLRAAK
jgi:hypothetical protein